MWNIGKFRTVFYSNQRRNRNYGHQITVSTTLRGRDSATKKATISKSQLSLKFEAATLEGWRWGKSSGGGYRW